MNRERLLQQLIYDEGKVPYAYKDSEGYWTIGVGRLIDEGKGGRLSEDEILYLLNNDVDKVLDQVQQEFLWFQSLSDFRQEVILNMVFNLGLSGFKRFRKAIAAIESKDWDEASVQMLDSKWARQVGRRATRLAAIMKTGASV